MSNDIEKNLFITDEGKKLIEAGFLDQYSLSYTQNFLNILSNLSFKANKDEILKLADERIEKFKNK